jgi:hypothetical protein
LAPFRSQMHLLGVKLDPFRTLKVQWVHLVLHRHRRNENVIFKGP